VKKSEVRNIIKKIIQEDHINKEGKMARFDSVELANDATDVANMISDDMNLPEWVEAKITLAADYMNKVKDYLTHHMDLVNVNNLYEKRIGFRGLDHADETMDLLQDFAKTGEMLNREIDKKQVSADDPLVQKILTILDDNLSIDTDFLNSMQMVLDLISELPDKEEKQKIGFKNE